VAEVGPIELRGSPNRDRLRNRGPGDTHVTTSCCPPPPDTARRPPRTSAAGLSASARAARRVAVDPGSAPGVGRCRPVDVAGPDGAGSVRRTALWRAYLFMPAPSAARLKLVYVTSMPVDPSVIGYLSLLRCHPSHARARLSLVSVGDSSATPLTEAAGPAAGWSARSFTAAFSHLLPYNTTRLERDLPCSAYPAGPRPRRPPRHEDRLTRGVRGREALAPLGSAASVSRRRRDRAGWVAPPAPERPPPWSSSTRACPGRKRRVGLTDPPAAVTTPSAALHDRVMGMTWRRRRT
jgi:hypothetical protein